MGVSPKANARTLRKKKAKRGEKGKKERLKLSTRTCCFSLLSSPEEKTVRKPKAHFARERRKGKRHHSFRPRLIATVSVREKGGRGEGRGELDTAVNAGEGRSSL